MSEDILKSEKLKEAFKNVMTAVEDIPNSEVIKCDVPFLVINDPKEGNLSCFAKGKVIDIANVLAMTARKYPDILKALKIAILMAE
jgi:hypothetical protein